MIRIATLCPLLILAACDRSTPSPQAGAAAKQAAPKPAPVSPVTGISQIQKAHTDLEKEIGKLEQQVQKGGPVAPWLVRSQIKMADHLILACKQSIPALRRQALEKRYGLQRKKQSALYKRRGELGAEIAEIRSKLDEASKGVGKIPEGFTRAELEDMAADQQEALRGLGKQIQELDKKMKANEDRLRGKAPLDLAATGDSLFARELEALQATRKRAQALLDQVGSASSSSGSGSR